MQETLYFPLFFLFIILVTGKVFGGERQFSMCFSICSVMVKWCYLSCAGVPSAVPPPPADWLRAQLAQDSEGCWEVSAGRRGRGPDSCGSPGLYSPTGYFGAPGTWVSGSGQPHTSSGYCETPETEAVSSWHGADPSPLSLGRWLVQMLSRQSSYCRSPERIRNVKNNWHTIFQVN